MTDEILIRPAEPGDAGAIAEVWLAAFRETYDFPPAHSDDEVRTWVANGLLPATDTWVVAARSEVVGFMAVRGSSVEQLYVRQPWTGKGIGSRLISLAKAARPAGLELWTFQVNRRARGFYERHGFTVAEMTDGSANQEHQPDVRYVWSPT